MLRREAVVAERESGMGEWSVTIANACVMSSSLPAGSPLDVSLCASLLYDTGLVFSETKSLQSGYGQGLAEIA